MLAAARTGLKFTKACARRRGEPEGKSRPRPPSVPPGCLGAHRGRRGFLRRCSQWPRSVGYSRGDFSAENFGRSLPPRDGSPSPKRPVAASLVAKAPWPPLVAFEKLSRPPAHSSLPEHRGRSCWPRETACPPAPVAVHAHWPPSLPWRKCPTRSPPKLEPNRRAGGWERLGPRMPRLRPGCNGTSGHNSCEESVGRGVALSLLRPVLPKHIGGQCSS